MSILGFEAEDLWIKHFYMSSIKEDFIDMDN